MKAIAINGSPRKSWNTATLLRKALAGAKAKGVKTKSRLPGIVPHGGQK